jgi:hypothetical protein
MYHRYGGVGNLCLKEVRLSTAQPQQLLRFFEKVMESFP